MNVAIFSSTVRAICCLRSSSVPWGHRDIGLYFFPENLRFDFLTYALNHLESILVCSVRYRYIYVSRWISACPGNIFWRVQLSALNWQTPLSCIKFPLMHGSVSKLSAVWLFLCECHTNLVIVLYYSLLFIKHVFPLLLLKECLYSYPLVLP